MIREILYKWFGLDDSCKTCNVLREQLARSERERSELLQKILDRDKPPSEPAVMEEIRPIQPRIIPWSVRQQMLEAEDRKKAQIMREKAKEIAELESELGIPNDGAQAKT